MITIQNKSCRIILYQKIIKVTLEEIIFKLKKQHLIIHGENLNIYYLDSEECMIQGNIKKVEFVDA